MCESPKIQQSTVYSYEECAFLIKNIYIPQIFHSKNEDYEGDFMLAWKNRGRLDHFLTENYEVSKYSLFQRLGIKCKEIIPLNVIGKFYFIEALNAINVEHYDEFTAELFSHLSGFIQQDILDKAIEVANRICYNYTSTSESNNFGPRVRIDLN